MSALLAAGVVASGRVLTSTRAGSRCAPLAGKRLELIERERPLRGPAEVIRRGACDALDLVEVHEPGATLSVEPAVEEPRVAADLAGSWRLFAIELSNDDQPHLPLALGDMTAEPSLQNWAAHSGDATY